ncbi:putative ribonuclease H-like domain-containing protein [Tanacetum coccineum]
MLISTDTNKLIEVVKTTWSTDSKLKVVIEGLQQGSSHDSKCTWSENELRGKGKLVVGNNEAVRLKLITYFHSSVVGVHSGVQETLKRIYAFFYWKGLGKMVKHQIYLCDVCQRNKLYLAAYPELLQPLPILKKVWKDVSMDFIKALPVSQGRTMIMVVVDRQSKYAHFIPLSHLFTTAQLAQAFLDNIYKLHGPPFTIVSDRDKESIWVRILRWEEEEKDLQNAKLTFAYRVVSNGTDILLGLKAFLKLLLLRSIEVGSTSGIRADGNSQMYLTFGKMLKNFDREDLEVLWSIVKARFKKTEPVNYMDTFLHLNLKTMFEHHIEDNVWKNQQGLVKVLNWKLYDSCGVHCVTMQNILYYLLVEKMYPLTKHKLHQMFNDVKLQVDYECKMAFELLRLVKKQLKEGYGRIVRIKNLLKVTPAKLVLLVQKLLLLMLKVNAAGIKVTTAERIKTAQRKDKDCLCDILVGKGQPHIVHGKPEQGGSVAPLLARDTKTESEGFTYDKEVVKIRNNLMTTVGADVLLLSPDGCREVEQMLW